MDKARLPGAICVPQAAASTLDPATTDAGLAEGQSDCSSFRAARSVGPGSGCCYSICYRIPVYAGMTQDKLIRISLK